MDIELFYREKGSGEPLILLHGNGEDGSYFVHQIEHFQSRYRVIALDTRGHGRSQRGSAPFTIRQFALDLYDFLRAHEIPSAVLLGFSDGVSAEASADAVSASGSSAAASAAVLPQAVSESSIAAASIIAISFFIKKQPPYFVLCLYHSAGS